MTDSMNQRIRQGFGRSAPDADDARRQSGIKDVRDMSVRVLLTEGAILTSRLNDAFEELAARADAAEAEEARGPEEPS
jgi:hypothetical protein